MPIRIDVHHAGENLIHMTRMLFAPVHVRHSYTFCGQFLYVTTFTLIQQSWIDSLLPRKSDPNSTSQYDWVAHGAQLSFSPKHSHWSSALKSDICWWTCYISLLGPYHQHVIKTFNTCSWGPTHRCLTNIGRGYNLRGVDLPHHTPWPS
jgi:hypothetical protein